MLIMGKNIQKCIFIYKTNETIKFTFYRAEAKYNKVHHLLNDNSKYLFGIIIISLWIRQWQ